MGSSLTEESQIFYCRKTLVKWSLHHVAPCARINCISRMRHSTGPRFLEVKGQGCRRACSPSTLQPASVAFASRADLSWRRGPRGSPAAEIAVLTRSRNFHFSSIPFPARTLPPESCHVAMISWLTPLAPVFTHAAMQAEGSVWDAFRSVMERRTGWTPSSSLGFCCKIDTFKHSKLFWQWFQVHDNDGLMNKGRIGSFFFWPC